MSNILPSSIYRRAFYFPALILLVACSQDRLPKSKVYLSDGTVYFRGYITEESINKALVLLQKSNNQLVITSEGGLVTHALKLANYLYDNQTEVTFRAHCYSSCANYILPATRKGVVKHGTVVGWHGGAYQPVWNIDLDNDPEAKQRHEEWKRTETDFYHKVKVDPKINVYGLVDNYEALLSQPYCMRLLRRDDWQGWTYKMSDIKKMGISIHFEDKEIPLGHRGGDDIQCYIYPFS